MGILIFLAILMSSVVAVPIQRSQENDIEKFVTIVPETKTSLIKTDSIKKTLKKHFTTKTSLVKDTSRKGDKNVTGDVFSKRNRKQKAFLLNNLNVFESALLDQNYQEKSNRQQFQESNVYYIKLPPTPYVFVPGLGYISNPPSYSFPSKPRPLKYNQNQVPLVKVPIDFVSNGKPTSVYSYSDMDASSQSPTVNLDKGPYVFNGSPMAFYLLDANGKALPKRPFKNWDYLKTQKDYY